MINSLFDTSHSERLSSFALLVLRVTAGIFMLTHGLPKLFNLLSGEEIKFAEPFGLSATTSLVLAVFAEFFCAALVILGLGTRIASFFLVITMAVAAFHAHASDPFATKEKALLYLLIFVILLMLGGGKYSADQFLTKRNGAR